MFPTSSVYCKHSKNWRWVEPRNKSRNGLRAGGGGGGGGGRKGGGGGGGEKEGKEGEKGREGKERRCRNGGIEKR